MKIHQFLLNSEQPDLHAWLEHALQELGSVVGCADPDQFGQRIGMVNPRVVFLSFMKAHAVESAQLAEQLASLYPDLPVIAAGNTDDAGVVVLAMRSGVRDFIDIAAAPGEAVRAVQRVAQVSSRNEPVQSGKVVVILGARPGVGATSLATNLAVHLRHHLRRQGDEDLLLMDMGVPTRDGALYMNLAPNFSFVDAVRNIRRFDKVFVQTALARHASGLSVLPLPVAPAEMKDVSYSDALGLMNRLRSYFQLQVVDLGGFNNNDFTAHLVKAADAVILVADQSVGAIVSAAELLQELRKRDVEINGVNLVISKFDARLGIDAAAIAERLELRSPLTLPDRR